MGTDAFLPASETVPGVSAQAGLRHEAQIIRLVIYVLIFMAFIGRLSLANVGC